MRSPLASCALVYFVVAPLGAALAQTPVDRRVPAEPNGIVEIRNVSGSVDVVPGEQREVRIVGTLADNVERLDVSADGNRVSIEVVLTEDSRSRDGTRLEIQAPPGSELRVETVSASIDVRGIVGEQRLSTVSGSLRTEGIERNLDAKSVSGSVTVNGGSKTAVTRAESVSGSVDLRGLRGEVEARSVSGGVRVAAETLSRAALSSISGAVSLRAGLEDNSRIAVNTTSGSVNVMLAGNAAADYELSTFSGNIDNCFGPAAEVSRGPPNRQLRFREGNSGARVELSSMSGGITMCRQ
jgi:putative adhesin